MINKDKWLEGFYDDVTSDDDLSPIPDMVARDVRRAIELGRLTKDEGDVLWLYVVKGFSLREIAHMCGRSAEWARKNFIAAVEKAEHVPHCGLITVLVETFNEDSENATVYWWKPLREYFQLLPSSRKPRRKIRRKTDAGK